MDSESLGDCMHEEMGLSHALLLDGRGGARSLSWEEVQAWQAEDGCLWLHFHFEHNEAQRWLLQHSGLSDIAYEALTTDDTRPRTVSRGDNLLLALRGINHNPGESLEDMVSLRLWTNGLRIISTYRRHLKSTEEILHNLEAGVGPGSVADLLVAYSDLLSGRMGGAIDLLEDSMLELEDALISGQIEGLRQELSMLRKKAVALRRYIAPQREAMNRLASERVSWLDEMNRLRLREVSDRLIRHIEDIDSVRERAAMVQEELISTISENLSQRSYVLTIVAAIFLPLGFFTGLMGINVGGMPGVGNVWAFWIVVGLCVSLVVLLGALFRFKKWL
ncbi:zinc transporter [Alteromonadaceae bacterium Bs31]|nr:zinc transporter [Alteromonadaceae bacterium Bs31]